LRGAKARGAQIAVNSAIETVERRGECWSVATRTGTFAARTLVNAAGAWADAVASMAGIAPLGLVPKRRTAFNVPVPAGTNIRGWPMIDDAGGEFYFKPDAGQLLVSPADATPSEPMDAYPDDVDVATGVERLERATTLTVTRVSRSWAGLRTFAHDASPVVGPDGSADGFVWFAGQGGYGIKTAPALSRACAALLRGRQLPEDLTRLEISAADLSPDRLRDRATASRQA
jgi:D-arginine dehydrogenase